MDLAIAGNGPVAAAWNQIRAGQFCGFVNEDEIKSAGYDCPRDQSAWTRSAAPQVLDKLVFAEAASRQISSDRCVAEAIETVAKNPGKKRKWESVVATSWLGLKKSQLMRAQCTQLFYNKLDQAEIKRHGLAGAYARRRPDVINPFPPETVNAWKETCLNEETHEALMQAERLFSMTLPVVSSTEAFDMIERNRESIINKKTGKALTDAELLAMDLSDLSQIRLKSDAKISADSKDLLFEHARQRRSMVKSLEARAAKEGGLQNLSSEERDYLYQETTVAQVMMDRGLIKVDMLGQPLKVSAGAACIMAWNDPTVVGEISEFVGTSLIPGGLVYKVLGATARFAKATKLSRLKTSMTAGMATVGVKDAVQQIRPSCLSEVGATPRMSKASQGDLFASIEGAALPAEVGYERWDFEFDPAETPSCAKGPGPNQVVNQAYRVHCVRDVLLNIVPLHVALPLFFL